MDSDGAIFFLGLKVHKHKATFEENMWPSWKTWTLILCKNPENYRFIFISRKIKSLNLRLNYQILRFFSLFQFKLDGCLKEKLDLDRPPYGYFGLIRVHETDRPVPEDQRPTWLDDPRGQGRRADVLPDDFPRTDKYLGPRFRFIN